MLTWYRHSRKNGLSVQEAFADLAVLFTHRSKTDLKEELRPFFGTGAEEEARIITNWQFRIQPRQRVRPARGESHFVNKYSLVCCDLEFARLLVQARHVGG